MLRQVAHDLLGVFQNPICANERLSLPRTLPDLPHPPSAYQNISSRPRLSEPRHAFPPAKFLCRRRQAPPWLSTSVLPSLSLLCFPTTTSTYWHYGTIRVYKPWQVWECGTSLCCDGCLIRRQMCIYGGLPPIWIIPFPSKKVNFYLLSHEPIVTSHSLLFP